MRATEAGNVDIGFAFLPQFTGMGYGMEAGTAVLTYAHSHLGLKRIVAITAPDNGRSIHLLEKLGLRFESTIHLAAACDELNLFALHF